MSSSRSPSTSAATTSDCCEFRPHFSCPERCRNCFCDASQHSAAATSRLDAQKSAIDEAAAGETTKSTGLKNDNKTMDGGGGECEQCAKKQAEIDRLKRELDEWQQRCRLAEEQSQRARDELQSLESEMEELHDNFKEEENEHFEQVKQELDACLKNCKILQIRLNKSERQYNQLEQVKQMLERQLQERLTLVEDTNENDCDTHQSGADWRQRRQQQRFDPTTTTTTTTVSYETQATATTCSGQAGTESGEEFVKLSASEYDQMLRDLNDTSERERDLQEQIKYSQEEAQLKGERLQAIEAENEILLGRINKLTLANSSLRSSTMLAGQQEQQQRASSNKETSTTNSTDRESLQKLRELCEQNEQLKLALELAQSETERLRSRIQESHRALEAREQALQEAEAKARRLTEVEEREQQPQASRASSRLELECRQLRARLVHSERECRQLRSQLECLSQGNATPASPSSGHRPAVAGLGFRSHSLESPPANYENHLQHATCASSKCQEAARQLERQCKSLIERNNQLELKLQKLIEMSNESLEQRTNMESELIEKLKRQLDMSEGELAKAKSRMVELDIECGRAQRQYKRLVSSLESCGSDGGEFQLLRHNKLPSESVRDSMGRQELRQAIRDLELDLNDLMTIIRAKECYIKEQEMSARRQQQYSLSGPNQDSGLSSSGDRGGGSVDRDEQQAKSQQQTSEQQVKSLRRLLDQEQLLNNNLKLDVANLERDNQELKGRQQVLERERLAMEEELDKLHQMMGELRAELEESESEKQRAQTGNHELQETVERLKAELEQARRVGRQSSQPSTTIKDKTAAGQRRQVEQASSAQAGKQQQTDLLVMARDLSELKVKNGFLMRQLELAREDAARQLDELRASFEAQQKRAVELAQIELKERHLQEGQQLRDELNDLKQKLAQLSRQAIRQEEETNMERDRARAVERDWRRDKSQWQQAREQLEGQLAIEKRSSEFRLKEAEAAIRDKERSLMSVQDRCVQLERDLKRLQNKYHLLEEDNESKIKQLTRDLEMRTKDLNEMTRQKQMLDEQQYETVRRLNDDKSTLKETLETIKRSYDEKLVEARQLRELLKSRQEQAYKERGQLVERVETMTGRLNEMSEQETQSKLLKQRLEIQERQLESVRRELSSLKEERTKLRDRCDELEKRELITKTSSISGLSPAHHHHLTSNSGSSFLRPFGSKAQLVGRAPSASTDSIRATSNAAIRATSGGSEQQQQQQQQAANTANAGDSQKMQLFIEKLSGKTNDQRNLINILRQQWNETQMELKQVKLLQASERSKWQANVAALTGRLNECEEKLVYETMVLQANPILIDQFARPKLDSNWTLERQANLELIKQQQAQIELLTRDLKKTSQAHDLLRLHSKQLESHNNKLSKKLIEFQQQFSFASQQDKQLESSYGRLLERHSRLVQELRPLVEIVTKIVRSLDAPEQAGGAASTKTSSSRGHSDSTERPLRAGVLSASARYDSDDSDASEQQLSTTVITTSRPAHQMNKTVQPTRLTRLLAGGKSHGNRESSPSASRSPDPTTGSKPAAVKTIRRVRVKCSTLGITTAEKKKLKEQLKKLAETIDMENEDKLEMEASKVRAGSSFSAAADGMPPAALAQPLCKSPSSSSRSHSSTNKNNSSDHHRQPHPHHHQVASVAAGQPEETDQSSQRSQAAHIRWQLDSDDIDSERSLSLEPNSESTATNRNDIYRRFPQATPSSGRPPSFGTSGLSASLTEYESESSLAASDYSFSGFTPIRSRASAPSGAESDSGIASSKVTRKKSTGFKGRLTSTLRNISRSIAAGLGSDAEDSNSGHLPSGGSTSRIRARSSSGQALSGAIRGVVSPSDANNANSKNKNNKSPPSQPILKEIRV